MKNFLKKINLKYIIWYFKKKEIEKKYDVILKNFSNIDNKCIFEGRNLVNEHTSLYNVTFGTGSYIAGNSKLRDVKIGRYCSIGQSVFNAFGQHPSREFVSTHPCFFSTQKQAGFTYVSYNIFDEIKYADTEKKHRIIIGNDVWIGNNVMLMDGIKIGDGVIIAAGAIVTKDVDSYTIIGGIPARIIRKRFNEEEINFLLKFKWWDKDYEWIKKHSHLFISIKEFKNAIFE